MPRQTKTPITTFGRRLRELRERASISQEKLGVAIGLDEAVATVRISRYETGVHEPPDAVAEQLAKVLGVLSPYFHCEDDDLANIILLWPKLTITERRQVLEAIQGLAVLSS